MTKLKQNWAKGKLNVNKSNNNDQQEKEQEKKHICCEKQCKQLKQKWMDVRNNQRTS